MDAGTFQSKLDHHTVLGALWRAEESKIRCLACAHRCLLADGHRGICKVRYNRAGRLHVPHGYVAGLAADPVEKKPFFHVHPGSTALTFGMLGCDFHCDYCQNWFSSQTLRDPDAEAGFQTVTREQVLAAAIRADARLLVSSYNEPLITSEWAAHIFEIAAPAGLTCAFVSNGHATPEVLDFLGPWIGAYKVDLKTFDAAKYRSLGGERDAVLKTIQMLRDRNIFTEVLTLMIPGFNDDDRQLHEIARFIAGVSRDIPWHVTAFHPDYKRVNVCRTMVNDLIRAAEIGESEGLRYVYAGNLPGRAGGWENTRCPQCKETLVERTGFQIRANRIGPEGCCPSCNTRIPGIWS